MYLRQWTWRCRRRTLTTETYFLLVHLTSSGNERESEEKYYANFEDTESDTSEHSSLSEMQDKVNTGNSSSSEEDDGSRQDKVNRERPWHHWGLASYPDERIKSPSLDDPVRPLAGVD